MSPRLLRTRLVAMATAMCERAIAKRLDQMADAGEHLALDPDAPEVVELREHCRRESEQIARERVESKRR